MRTQSFNFQYLYEHIDKYLFESRKEREPSVRDELDTEWQPKWPESGPSALALKVLKFEMLFINYNPFMIYNLKRSFYRRNPRYRLFDDQKLRSMNKAELEFVRYFHFDRNINKNVQLSFFGYFICKTLIVLLIQYLTRTYDNKHGIWLLISRGMVLHLYKFLGNPLSELFDLAIYLYISISTMVLVFLIFSPWYYNKYPMDVASIRFSLDSSRELLRVDALIDEKIDELLTSLDFFKFEQLKKNNCSGRLLLLQSTTINSHLSRSRFSASSSDQQILWKHLDRYKEKLISYKTRLWSLRPINYNRQFFELSQKDMVNFLLNPFFMNILWSLATGPFFYLWAMNGKCKAKQLIGPECNPWNAFNLQELIFIVETFSIFVVSIQTYSLHMALISILGRSQLSLIENIRKDLTKCLEYLRETNMQRSNYRPPFDDCVSIHSDMKHFCDTQSDMIMLETLVKMLVCRDELRAGSRCMAQLMQLFIVNSISLTTLVFFAGGFEDEVTKVNIRTNVVTNWIITNAFALLCARIHAQFSKVSPLYWSILAENILRTNNIRQSGDLTSKLWHKLVYSADSINDLCSVKPFNVTMTFRRSIEINFFLISLYSLVRIN